MFFLNPPKSLFFLKIIKINIVFETLYKKSFFHKKNGKGRDFSRLYIPKSYKLPSDNHFSFKNIISYASHMASNTHSFDTRSPCFPNYLIETNRLDHQHKVRHDT